MTLIAYSSIASLAAVALLAPVAAGADDAVKLTFVPKGGSAKAGYYAPQKSTFSTTKPNGFSKVPADLAAPQFGTLAIGKGVLFILDEPEGGKARLFVDSNRNGDLTDDAPTEWGSRTVKRGDTESTMWNGAAVFELVPARGSATPVFATIQLYRFDPKDPTRAANKDALLYYRDYGYEGEVPLAGKSMRALLLDEQASGAFTPKAPATPEASSGVVLLLDVNGNGKFDRKGESFDAAKPFNVGGTTYEFADIAADGSSFRIIKSSKSVEAVPTPPDLSAGAAFPAFKASDTKGVAVDFPADFKGKVVLVDFWATWCGPCMAEMPNVVSAYDKFHGKGFEVLGISLDNDKTISRMPEVMEKAKMTWRQIADGKGWKAALADKFAIDSIPATFLVDGTTGKIIGADLRGEALAQAVEKALAAQKR